MSCSKLSLKEFPIENFKPDRTVLLIGRRGTGKSCLMKHLMRYMSRFYDLGLAICPTMDTIRELREFICPTLIYDDVDKIEGLLLTVIEQLKILNDCGKRLAFFVILDDCMFDAKFLKTKAMRDVFMNGRHYDIFFINCVQYCMDIVPAIRSNTDYIFALKETSPENRAKLHKVFFGGTSLQDFNNIYDACTEDNRCIVLDNVVRTNDYTDRVYWYRANLEQPNFLLGNRTCWKLHYMMHRPIAAKVDFETEDFFKKLSIMNGQEGQGEANPKKKKVKKEKEKKSKNKKNKDCQLYDEIELIEEKGPIHHVNAAQLKLGIPDTPKGAQMVEQMRTDLYTKLPQLLSAHANEMASSTIPTQNVSGNPLLQPQPQSSIPQSSNSDKLASQSSLPPSLAAPNPFAFRNLQTAPTSTHPNLRPPKIPSQGQQPPAPIQPKISNQQLVVQQSRGPIQQSIDPKISSQQSIIQKSAIQKIPEKSIPSQKNSQLSIPPERTRSVVQSDKNASVNTNLNRKPVQEMAKPKESSNHHTIIRNRDEKSSQSSVLQKPAIQNFVEKKTNSTAGMAHLKNMYKSQPSIPKNLTAKQDIPGLIMPTFKKSEYSAFQKSVNM